MQFSKAQSARVARFLELQEEQKFHNADIEYIGKEMDRLKALIAADLGTSCTGICEDGCTVTWKPTRRSGVSKENLLRMKEVHPEIYAEYVTTSESRRFSVKKSKPEAA